MSESVDLFISTGEPSGDLHGFHLINELLKIKPTLKIGAVSGPKMRTLPIKTFFNIEDLSVMGFIDVLLALPKIILQFFRIRNQILKLNPKAVLLIDYPSFHLQLEKHLRKKGYTGKLIHYISPTVWAWKKKRAEFLSKYVDLLLTIFPFEKAYFSHLPLRVEYIGHPLANTVANFKPRGKFSGKIIALFPGSRKAEIDRNLPLQLAVARTLKELDPSLQIAISQTRFPLDVPDALIVPPEDHYELMQAAHLALATSGTVTLELALHGTPTVVTFAIKPLDCYIAQNILHINLPYFALPNIVLNRLVFPELFGPNLTEENLFFHAHKLCTDIEARNQTALACCEIRNSLTVNNSTAMAAHLTLSTIDF